MDSYETDIRISTRKLGLSRLEFSQLDLTRSTEVARLTRERFVLGAPRVWWLGLAPPHERRSYDGPDDWKNRLLTMIPEGTTRCWLIGEPAPDVKLHPVYDAQLEKALDVLAECRFFEYYLVDKDLQWLIADTDHNELLFAKPILTP